METILDKIIIQKRLEVEIQKREMPIATMLRILADSHPLPKSKVFSKAIANSSTGIIAEFKRKSPSRDWIHQDAKIEDIIPYYSLKGASAISVLTDEKFFGGKLDDLRSARNLTDTPLLRKDFIVDEYQIYQAVFYGANAILLIAASLTQDETKSFAKTAKDLGLDVLLEIHNEHELDYIGDNIDVVGINNRNLKTFVTDIQVSYDLGNKIPDTYIKISESGISDPQTVKDLRQVGFRGFLMGENFMKTKDPAKALGEFIKELENED